MDASEMRRITGGLGKRPGRGVEELEPLIFQDIIDDTCANMNKDNGDECSINLNSISGNLTEKNRDYTRLEQLNGAQDIMLAV